VKNQRRLLFNDFKERNLKYHIRSIQETDNEAFQREFRGSGVGFTRVRIGQGVDEGDEEGVNKAKTYENGNG
jgi:hypothetical protein